MTDHLNQLADNELLRVPSHTSVLRTWAAFCPGLQTLHGAGQLATATSPRHCTQRSSCRAPRLIFTISRTLCIAIHNAFAQVRRSVLRSECRLRAASAPHVRTPHLAPHRMPLLFRLSAARGGVQPAVEVRLPAVGSVCSQPSCSQRIVDTGLLAVAGTPNGKLHPLLSDRQTDRDIDTVCGVEQIENKGTFAQSGGVSR